MLPHLSPASEQWLEVGGVIEQLGLGCVTSEGRKKCDRKIEDV